MLRIGIVGSGFGLYGLLPAFSSIKNCQIVSICGKKTPRLVKYCESIGLKNIYTDWSEMLKNEQLDAIAIAVVPSAQYKIATAAINKGLHIFAEKPLAANLKQAEELYKLAKSKGITTAVDFIFPEIEQWKKVKTFIDEEVFGKLSHISVNWDFESYDIRKRLVSWKTNSKQGGGALSFYFSHSLYYLEYFAGDIIKVQSSLIYSPESLGKAEVGADILLKFKKGISGYAHISANSKGVKSHRLTFICQQGTLILENLLDVTKSFTVKVFSGGKEKNIKFKNRESLIEDERVREVKKIARRFIKACILHKQMTPSFLQGLRVQKLINQIKLEQI